MSSGTVKFSVDGAECLDTNGVGASATGGVFNCGLSGNTFKLECLPPGCTGELAIVELKIWKQKLLNLAGSPYMMSGSVYESPWTAADL